MIVGAASISPEDAQSNLAGWVDILGIDWLANLISPEVNSIIFWLAVVLFLISIAYFWGPATWKHIVFWRQQPGTPRKKNERQEPVIPMYKKTSRTTESESIKESTLQRKTVDRQPLDHAYRILKYMGVYRGEGDKRTGISNMLRQAALDGDIIMWGVEIANQSLDRCVLLKIPPDYWANYAIDETGFEKSAFVGPDSIPHKLYWHLHADMDEIKVKYAKLMEQSNRWDWVDRKQK